VEVKIGIQSVPRELVLESSESFDEIERALREAVAASSVLKLADTKGGLVLVPSDKIAYLELSGNAQRRVGFASI
jgi:hypothetical protein